MFPEGRQTVHLGINGLVMLQAYSVQTATVLFGVFSKKVI